jgi:GT2 family glycosyltransferase
MVAGLPQISVVIVNWNSNQFVRDCLDSLFTHAKQISFEVIVVDNASYDGCGEMLASRFPSVTFVQSDSNLGFAAANNLGARQARGDFLLLLNPDTVLAEDSLAVLFHEVKKLPNAGAVGCRLLNRDGSLQTSCVQAFPTLLNQTFSSEFLLQRYPNSKHWGAAALYQQPPCTTIVEVISGACMLLPCDAFAAVGGFTESYFMYSEDVDLCYKLKKAGRHVYYVPFTSITHFGGGSTKQAASDFSNEMVRVAIQHFMLLRYGAVSALGYRIAMGTTALTRLIFIGPFLIFGRKIVRHGADSWRKWWVVLRWAITGAPRGGTPSRRTRNARPSPPAPLATSGAANS